MSGISDYLGRTNDLCVFEGVQAAGMADLTPKLGNLICTGAQKMAQTVALLFLTDKGSDPFYSDRGTGFMPAAKHGRLATGNDVTTEFSMAASDVIRQMQVFQPADAKDDEILVSMTLMAFSLEAGNLMLKVRLTTQAGPSRAIILPIAVPIGK